MRNFLAVCGILIALMCGGSYAFGSDQVIDVNNSTGLAGSLDKSTVTNIDELNTGTLLYYIPSENRYIKAPDLSMEVYITITGIVSKTRFTQVFANPHKEWLEATYVFPLPENASVNKLRLLLSDRVIEGTIMEKSEAKQVYEEAKENGEQAALLEESRPNMFVTRVANIPPGEKVTVELEYLNTLAYDDGTYSLRFPLVITTRYNPDRGKEMTRELDSALSVLSKNSPRVLKNDFANGKVKTFNDPIGASPVLLQPILDPGHGLRNPVNIRISLAPGFSVESVASLYHSVNAIKNSDDSYSITLANGPVPADRDFVLLWKPVTRGISDASVFVEEKNGAFYSLVMIIPTTVKSSIPMTEREVIFIFDHSGSMFGASLAQAKAALSEAFSRLGRSDSFNLIVFNDSYAQVFDECVSASPDNKERASAFVSGLQADGGTEMKRALVAALGQKHSPGKLRQIIFITDGAVSDEAELLAIIKNGLGEGKLFTVGIGSAPNTFFMKKAAEMGSGTCEFIGDGNEVKDKMSALFAKIENPVLTDIRVAIENNTSDIMPARVPDLYMGEPIVILSKLGGSGGLVHITGAISEKGTGNTKLFTRDLDLANAEPGSGIAFLWAQKKIESLLDGLYEGEAEESVKPAVLNLALEHGVVSPYTSLVAVEHRSVRPKGDGLEQKEVPLNPPHGFDVQQGAAAIGQTGTLSDLLIEAGILALVVSFVFLIVLRRHYGKKIHAA